MASGLTVKLLSGEYDQPNADGRGATKRRRGEVFTANSQEEYDHLTRVPERNRPGQTGRPIAIDPDKELELQQQNLDRERARIEAAQAELDAQKASLDAKESGQDPRDASDLKGKELSAALERFGLDDSGSAEEKRGRVQEYLDANPDASLTEG
jgi:hypothetical protein